MLKSVIDEKLIRSGKGNNNIFKEIYSIKKDYTKFKEVVDVNKLEEVSEELKELEKQEQTLRNKIYVLTSEHNKLSQEECKKDIGRCFKKLGKDKTIYIKITGVHELEWSYRGYGFNEYQRPSIQFAYPYNNSSVPFIEKDIHSNAWNRKDSDYIEISNKEFTKAFNEVNSDWIKNISNI